MPRSRRLLAAWHRHWFAPASLTQLGIARAIVAAIFLVLEPGTRYLGAALVPAVFWHPERLVALPVLTQPDVATVVWLGRLTTLLLVLALLGIVARPALWLLLPLVVVQEAWLNAAGKITHGTIPLVWALLFLALAPSHRGFALGAVWRRARAAAADPTGLAPSPARSPDARWPLELIFVELAAFYAAAGVTKLRTSGLAWADGSTLQYHLLLLGTPAGERVAASMALCAALSALVLAFELGAPLGIVRRLRPLVLAGGAAFHLGTTLLMRIAFWPVVALYAVFIPWPRLAARAATAAGLRPNALVLPYDAACGRCRALVSVVRDLDPAGRVRAVPATAPSARPSAARLARMVPALWPLLPLAPLATRLGPAHVRCRVAGVPG
jgi:hypothetical protein